MVAQLAGVDIVIICAYDIGVLFLVDALKVRSCCFMTPEGEESFLGWALS